MKRVIIVLLGIGILVGLVLTYQESVTIMKGDYILTRWVGVEETNKNWGMVFWLGIVGGCSVYILRKLALKVINKKEVK